LHERAVSIYERALGKKHQDVAWSLSNLGLAHERLSSYDLAQACYEQALAICRAGLPDDHPNVAEVLANLGWLRARQGAYDEARDLCERAVRVKEKAFGRNNPELAHALNSLALVLEEQGSYTEARRIHERVLIVTERALGREHPHVASTLNNLAGVRRKQGALEQAMRLFERSLLISEETLGQDHPDVADVLHNLGTLLSDRGDHAEARALLERAIMIREKSLGTNHPDMALSLNALGVILKRQRFYDEARAAYERALHIWERALGENHPVLADILNNLGVLLWEQGAYETAHYERALLILEEPLGKDHPRVAGILNNLGLVASAQGSWDEAQSFLERSLAIKERTLGSDHLSVADALSNIGELLKVKRAYGEARDFHARALAIVGRNLRGSLAGTLPSQRLEQAASARWTLDNWLRITARTGEVAYDAVLRFKGIVGRLERSEQRVLRTLTGANQQLFLALRAAQDRLTTLGSAPPQDTSKLEPWRRQYAEAAALCQELSLELTETSRQYRAVQEHLALGISDIRASLKKGEVIVDYLRYRARFAVWIVPQQGDIERIELGWAAEIQSAVIQFRKALLREQAGNEPQLAAAGESLRALIWEPVERCLPESIGTVYLIPDAELAAVPFAALPGRNGKTCLLEERTLVHLASAQDLIPWKESVATGTGLLAMGAVDFDRALASRAEHPAAPSPVGLLESEEMATATQTVAALAFAALPETGPEAAAVTRCFRETAVGEPARVLRGGHASEVNLRKLAGGKRVLHLATHGFVRHDRPSALSREQDTPDALLRPSLERHLVGYDPMMLTGLALAGANRLAGGEGSDGLLTAREAQNLNLDGVELVVLSACDTARGDDRAGDGVLGLVRGFQAAGARTVVASLWPVDDRATRRLMERLYREGFARETRRPAAVALRHAAIALRDLELRVIDARASAFAGKDVYTSARPFAAPRHWAAFVAYGPLR
ncbi:tetratricopeptide repeat protein, partial [Planctomycetota bacterium]